MKAGFTLIQKMTRGGDVEVLAAWSLFFLLHKYLGALRGRERGGSGRGKGGRGGGICFPAILEVDTNMMVDNVKFKIYH
jgi:hypothetical protein